MKNFKFKNIILLSHRDRKAFQTSFHHRKNLIVGKNHTGKSSIIKSLFLTLGAPPNGVLANWDKDTVSVVEFTVDSASYTAVYHMSYRGLFDARGHLLMATKKDSEWTETFCDLTGFNLTLLDKNKNTVSAGAKYFFLPFYIDQDSSWAKEWNTFKYLQQFSSFAKHVLEYFSGIKPPEYYLAEAKKQLEYAKKDEFTKELALLERAKVRLGQSISLIGPRINAHIFESEINDLTKEVNELNKDQEQVRERIVKEADLISSLVLQIKSAKAAIKTYDENLLFLEHPGREKLVCPTCHAEHNESFMEFLNFAEEARILRDLVTKLEEDLSKTKSKHIYSTQLLRNLSNKYRHISQILETKKGLMEFKDVVESSGAERALKAFYEEADLLKNLIDECAKYIRDLEHQQKLLRSNARSSEILSKFRASYLDSRIKLNLPPVATQKLQLNQRPNISGSGGPRAILAYYAALWETINSETGYFCAPLVIDSPNQKAQDEFNLPKVIKFIAEELPPQAQVIMGSEINLEYAFDNVIELNDPYKLLEERQFENFSEYIDSLLKVIYTSFDKKQASPIQPKDIVTIVKESFVDKLKTLPLAKRNIEIENKISEQLYKLFYADAASEYIIETDPESWVCNDFNIEFYRIEKNNVISKIFWSAQYTPFEDEFLKRMQGTATAVISESGEVVFKYVKAYLDEIMDEEE